MKAANRWGDIGIVSKLLFLIAMTGGFFSINADEQVLPEKMQRVMQQTKYQHANWGLYFKDSETEKIIYELNADKMFLPASTTKLFSVAALLHEYGEDYCFKTPVFAQGVIQNGKLKGDLILVAQGDLVMGGRQESSNTIAFTKLDHIIANEVPGASLTKEDPLNGLVDLAKQIGSKGIKEIEGDVLIDDRLFEITEKRELILSPIMINENLIDLIIHPKEANEAADVSWRPMVQGYTVTNEIKTVAQGPLDIKVTSDELKRNIILKGTIPKDQKEVIRTFPIKDPNHFARAAFIQALRSQGISIKFDDKKSSLPSKSSFKDLNPLAVWTSPPLSEYAKLILKVSHNLGADLIPLLLAVHRGEKTFDQGMLILGDFVEKELKISPTSFVFIDGAGGNENRLTPQAEVELLQYIKKLTPKKFQSFFEALPILGVDGSLADFGKGSAAEGKVHAKTGTGVSFNLAINKFFLTTQALAGYIEGKNGHLIEFMVVVNNGTMPAITDVFSIFEDLSEITNIVYELYTPQ